MFFPKVKLNNRLSAKITGAWLAYENKSGNVPAFTLLSFNLIASAFPCFPYNCLPSLFKIKSSTCKSCKLTTFLFSASFSLSKKSLTFSTIFLVVDNLLLSSKINKIGFINELANCTIANKAPKLVCPFTTK